MVDSRGREVTKDGRFTKVYSDPRFKRDPRRRRRRLKTEAENDRVEGGSSSEDDRRFVVDSDDERFARHTGIDKYGRKLGSEEDEKEPESHSSAEEESDENEEVDVLQSASEEENVELGNPARRLALLNVDWSRLSAVDILVILRSFCPKDGQVEKVTVYKSNYGLEQMEKEALEGPPVLKIGTGEIDSEPNGATAAPPMQSAERSQTKHADRPSDGDDENGSDSDESDDVDVLDGYKVDTEREAELAKEKIRAYEKSRLKFFYAVIKCDSVKTASCLYDQCDGIEYERSGSTFDIRFVPDEVTFNNPVRDVADEVPASYEPPVFTTKALQSTNVQLTWDEDKNDRSILRKKHLSKDQVLEQDMKAYLASSSESEKDDESDITRKREMLLGKGTNEKVSAESAQSHSESEEKDDNLEGVEIKFEPGLADVGSEILSAKRDKEAARQETPWEARLRKMKERRKEKRRAKKMEKLSNGAADGQANGSNDGFFEEDSGSGNDGTKESQRLELLTMDAKPNLHDSSDDETRKSRKGRNSHKSGRNASDDRFKADLDDKRFASLYTSQDFALDPTHPKFVKNKGTVRLLKAREEQRKTLRERGNSRIASVPLPRTDDALENRRGKNLEETRKLAERVKRRAKNSEVKPRKKTRI